MEKLQVGTKVKVLKNWSGNGTVTKIYQDDNGYQVTMDDGPFKGMVGGFDFNQVKSIERMEILTIKRSKEDTGLKVYGTIKGESGKVYQFGYYRRPTFRGWLCNCESFLLDKMGKKRNCKHIRFVRQTHGRFAASVQ